MEAQTRKLGVLLLDFLVMLLSKRVSMHYQGLRPHAEKEVTREHKNMPLEIWRAGSDGRTQGMGLQSEAEGRLLWATAVERPWLDWLQGTAGSLFIHHTI